MMFRHVAVFRWRPDVSPERVARLEAELARLPTLMPQLRSFSFGPDRGRVEGNWDFVVVAEFDDRDGWLAYMGHPEHQRVIREALAPIRLERAAIQYEVR